MHDTHYILLTSNAGNKVVRSTQGKNFCTLRVKRIIGQVDFHKYKSCQQKWHALDSIDIKRSWEGIKWCVARKVINFCTLQVKCIIGQADFHKRKSCSNQDAGRDLNCIDSKSKRGKKVKNGA